MSGLLLGTVVGLHCWFHNTVSSPSVPVYTNFCTRPYNCLFYNFPPISLHVLQCSSAHTVSSLYILFFYQYWKCWYGVLHCLIRLFTVYIFSLFLFVIFLSHDIWFAMSDLVLPLFHFQSLPSDLPSTAITTCFLNQSAVYPHF